MLWRIALLWLAVLWNGSGGGDGSGAGDGDPGGEGEGDPPGSGAGTGEGDTASGGDAGNGADVVTMTQADFDRHVASIVAKERKRAETKLREQYDREKMDEHERALAEATDRATSGEQRAAQAGAALVRSTARAAAAEAGVTGSGRLDRFMAALGNALDGVALEWDDDSGVPSFDVAEVRKVVEVALQDLPEFLPGNVGDGAGGSGVDPKGDGTQKVWTRAEIDQLSMGEYEEHADEIRRQVAAGLVK